jgi:phosphoribosylformylglycinamidine (FGAM) synthase-like amidotransferase family enzyme
VRCADFGGEPLSAQAAFAHPLSSERANVSGSAGDIAAICSTSGITNELMSSPSSTTA